MRNLRFRAFRLPTFLLGLGSVLSLGSGGYEVINKPLRYENPFDAFHDDARAIQEDFEVVGEDYIKAVDNVVKQSLG